MWPVERRGGWAWLWGTSRSRCRVRLRGTVASSSSSCLEPVCCRDKSTERILKALDSVPSSSWGKQFPHLYNERVEQMNDLSGPFEDTRFMFYDPHFSVFFLSLFCHHFGDQTSALCVSRNSGGRVAVGGAISPPFDSHSSSFILTFQKRIEV